MVNQIDKLLELNNLYNPKKMNKSEFIRWIIEKGTAEIESEILELKQKASENTIIEEN